MPFQATIVLAYRHVADGRILLLITRIGLRHHALPQ